MAEFGATPPHRLEPVAGGWSIEYPRVVSAEESHRSGQGGRDNRIDAGAHEAPLARELSTPRWGANHLCDLQSFHGEGLRDRATGPGDARSGGGAWLASSGPSFMTIE